MKTNHVKMQILLILNKIIAYLHKKSCISKKKKEKFFFAGYQFFSNSWGFVHYNCIIRSQFNCAYFKQECLQMPV